MSARRNTVTLSCGCSFATAWTPPEPFGWSTCTQNLGHQASYRIVSAVPLPGVPGPGETGVQEPLWADDALLVAASLGAA